MFQIQMCLRESGTWFRIWESLDGADCAEYLKTCVINEDRPGTEYRLIYIQPKVAA